MGDPAHEYQCVWNAAGITDNQALAGGVSEFLFPPADVYEDGARGTKACRVWPLDDRINDNVKFPVLPLQNTVAGKKDSGNDEARVMTNSEAHVLSYRHDWRFEVEGLPNVRAREDVKQLTGAHIGGIEKLYLMLTMRQKEARVEIAEPLWRLQTARTGAWPQRLLLTCAVVDVTRWVGNVSAEPREGHGGVRVEAGMQTFDGVAVSTVQLPWRGGAGSEAAIQRGILTSFSLQFTGIVDAAITRWQSKVRQSECALGSVRKFLENEKACEVLGSEKVLLMQVRVRVTDGCTTACRDSVRRAPVLLFMLDTPFESALVAGAAESVDEVALGPRSENKVEESQRRALRRMQNFTAADQHTWVGAAHFERELSWGGEERMRQAHAVDAYSRCAVLVSTTKNISCVGSQGIHRWWIVAPDNVQCALGVGFAEVNNLGCVLALLQLKREWPSGQVFELTSAGGSLAGLDLANEAITPQKKGAEEMRGTNVPPTRSAALRVLWQGGQLRDTWHWRRRAAVAVWAQRVCELCADGRFRRGARRTGPLVPVCLSCVGEARNRHRRNLTCHLHGQASDPPRALWSVAYCRLLPLRQASARPAAHVLRRRTAPPARS
jgi:hypothetical protein